MQKEFLFFKQAPGFQKWDTFSFKMLYKRVRPGWTLRQSLSVQNILYWFATLHGKLSLNMAFVGYEEFCRLRRVLSIEAVIAIIIALLFIQNISFFLKEFHHYALCFSAHQI